MSTDGIDALLANEDLGPEAIRLLRAARAREEGKRCDCDLRDAQWCPLSGLCLRCGGLSWDRKWWTTKEDM